MNLESWVKNPRHRTILLGGVGVAVFGAMAWFTLRPLLTQKSAAAHELAALEEKIQAADLLMKQETRLREDLAQATQELRTAFRDHLPTAAGALSWSTARVYQYARLAGLEIEAIKDVKLPPPPWEKKKGFAAPSSGGDAEGVPPPPGGTAAAEPRSTRQFVPYAVEITLQGGYTPLTRFVAAMEEGNPYLNVVALSITVQGNAPERHQVRMSVEWPRYTGKADPLMGL